MILDRIYQKVKTFVNTEIRGNVSPEEFNLFAHDAIQDRKEEFIFDINKAINRENRGLVTHFLENIPDRIREKFLHYHKEDVITPVTTNTYALPDDLEYVDTIENEDGTYFEFCKNRREFNITKTVATSQYPIYAQSGSAIKVAPDYSGDITISYMRKPNVPKWTYVVVNGAELFNPSAGDFVDADIHPSEENEIVRRILMRFGVNLKEEDIQAFTVQQENIQYNQENQS